MGNSHCELPSLARLRELRKPFEEMLPEERIALVRAIREERQLFGRMIREERTARRAVLKRTAKAREILQDLPQGDLLELLRKIEG
jgi:hypothetical protein